MYTGADAIESRNTKEIAKQLHRDTDVRRALSFAYEGDQKQSAKTMQGLIENVVARVVPAYQLNEFSNARHNKTVSTRSDFRPETTQSLIPESFLKSYFEKGYSRRDIRGNANDRLSADSVKIIEDILGSNADMTRAALSSGIARRNNRGALELA